MFDSCHVCGCGCYLWLGAGLESSGGLPAEISVDGKKRHHFPDLRGTRPVLSDLEVLNVATKLTLLDTGTGSYDFDAGTNYDMFWTNYGWHCLTVLIYFSLCFTGETNRKSLEALVSFKSYLSYLYCRPCFRLGTRSCGSATQMFALNNRYALDKLFLSVASTASPCYVFFGTAMSLSNIALLFLFHRWGTLERNPYNGVRIHLINESFRLVLFIQWGGKYL